MFKGFRWDLDGKTMNNLTNDYSSAVEGKR
jgi:hypothetical protein